MTRYWSVRVGRIHRSELARFETTFNSLPWQTHSKAINQIEPQDPSSGARNFLLWPSQMKLMTKKYNRGKITKSIRWRSTSTLAFKSQNTEVRLRSVSLERLILHRSTPIECITRLHRIVGASKTSLSKRIALVMTQSLDSRRPTTWLECLEGTQLGTRSFQRCKASWVVRRLSKPWSLWIISFREVEVIPKCSRRSVMYDSATLRGVLPLYLPRQRQLRLTTLLSHLLMLLCCRAW